MAKREEANRLATAAVERLGKVDILVNNAGLLRTGTIEELTDELMRLAGQVRP